MRQLLLSLLALPVLAYGADMAPDTQSNHLRDPNAYSDGYTLDSGPYVLPGPRQLHMADEDNFGHLLADEFEWQEGGVGAYDMQAWYGGTFNRVLVKAEGEYQNSQLEDARTELLWDHAISAFWNLQAGVRSDNGEGPARQWLALGVEGLAPYWLDVEATAYVGDNGRTAARVEAEYDLLITHRLILTPKAEMNLYGKSDQARGIGSGLSDASLGLRLRYEITRQFAPYVGFEYQRKLGNTADLARSEGDHAGETKWLAGVRFWF
ncbi:copper resistance protein B [Gallaecimonas mangrovi]|uniref:copper resistance protein B n=1 Tax=Gallaecimonas mangrovi TaxID=2291597 RepID=UPI001D0112EA|nr:copper resistance protein B [Gallaecimonas mangrovi]